LRRRALRAIKKHDKELVNIICVIAILANRESGGFCGWVILFFLNLNDSVGRCGIVQKKSVKEVKRRKKNV
jgi:hypothetical protein